MTNCPSWKDYAETCQQPENRTYRTLDVAEKVWRIAFEKMAERYQMPAPLVFLAAWKEVHGK